MSAPKQGDTRINRTTHTHTHSTCVNNIKQSYNINNTVKLHILHKVQIFLRSYDVRAPMSQNQISLTAWPTAFTQEGPDQVDGSASMERGGRAAAWPHQMQRACLAGQVGKEMGLVLLVSESQQAPFHDALLLDAWLWTARPNAYLGVELHGSFLLLAGR